MMSRWHLSLTYVSKILTPVSVALRLMEVLLRMRSGVTFPSHLRLTSLAMPTVRRSLVVPTVRRSLVWKLIVLLLLAPRVLFAGSRIPRVRFAGLSGEVL